MSSFSLIHITLFAIRVHINDQKLDSLLSRWLVVNQQSNDCRAVLSHIVSDYFLSVHVRNLYSQACSDLVSDILTTHKLEGVVTDQRHWLRLIGAVSMHTVVVHLQIALFAVLWVVERNSLANDFLGRSFPDLDQIGVFPIVVDKDFSCFVRTLVTELEKPFTERLVLDGWSWNDDSSLLADGVKHLKSLALAWVIVADVVSFLRVIVNTFEHFVSPPGKRVDLIVLVGWIKLKGLHHSALSLSVSPLLDRQDSGFCYFVHPMLTENVVLVE
jgi:hypothetical protein